MKNKFAVIGLAALLLTVIIAVNVHSAPRKPGATPNPTVVIKLSFVNDNATVWAPSPIWFSGATGEYFNFQNQTASGINLFKIYPDGTMEFWEDVPAGVSDTVEAFLDNTGKPVIPTQGGTNVNYNVGFVIQ